MTRESTEKCFVLVCVRRVTRVHYSSEDNCHMAGVQVGDSPSHSREAEEAIFLPSFWS
jgi:hypothetical protein